MYGTFFCLFPKFFFMTFFLSTISPSITNSLNFTLRLAFSILKTVRNLCLAFFRGTFKKEGNAILPFNDPQVGIHLVLAIRQTLRPPRRKLFPGLVFRKLHLENGSIVTSNTCKKFNLRFTLKLDYYEFISFQFFIRCNLAGKLN